MKKYLIWPFLLILLWETIVQLNFVDRFLLPSFFTIIITLFEILFSWEIILDLLSTVYKVIFSFLIAWFVWIPIWLVLGQSEKTYRKFEFIIDFFRSTPATAIFPIFILIFWVSDNSKIAVASFASMLIVIFNTSYWVINSNKSRILAANIMWATKK
jgi:NitT/TauT family transport system permease protein